MASFCDFKMLICLLLIVANSAGAQDSRPGVVTSDPVVYRIKMKTTFVVPVENEAIDVIRVWHALPTLRPWSDTDDDLGVTKIRRSSGGVLRHKASHKSDYNYWRIDETQRPGKKHAFTTQFVVRSVRRNFLPDKVDVQWKDYETPSEDPEATVDPAKASEVHPQLAELAAEIKRTYSPPAAVREFCKWIDSTITYDASVSYSTRDIEAIIDNHRGHCGHRSHVLRQLCWHAGIPLRRARGLNLNTPNGRGRLHAIKADYTNVHTWAEVYFPGIGWIEVEPSNGKHAYRIPAQMIQNNQYLQNYTIRIRENGKFKKDTWTYNQGKYQSNYGVENVIMFSKRSL